MAPWLQPVVKSIVLCDDVMPGPPGTENVHLMNVFSAIRPTRVPPFPYRLTQACVFLQLTDAEGRIEVQIIVKHLESDQIVFASSEHLIDFEHRLQAKWVLFRLRDCPLPDPGLYCIEFHCNGQWVTDLTFSALD